MAKKGVIVPRRDGLVGEWLLNGNALDTASTNNGTATNVTYTNTDRGYQKQTGVFNGSSASIDMGTNKFPSIVNNCTLTCWVNNNSISAVQSIFSNGNNASGSDLGWCFGIKLDGANNTYNFTKPGIINENTGITPSTGANDFICLTIEGYRGKLYINGALVWTGSNTTTIPNNSQKSKIGAHTSNGSASQFYNGKIQSVRLFSRVLGIDEIQNWYLEGLRKLGGGSMSGLFDGIVAYYDMKGDANDIVGGNNGTVSGAVLTTDYFGFSNSSYDFDGTNDIITAGGVAITTAYTVFGISKFDTIGTGAGERYIFRLHNSGTSILYFMTYQDKWYVYHSGGAKVLQPTSPTPSTGTYYYWAITYNGSTVELYVNGASAGTVGSATTLGANNTLDIGGRAGVGFQDGINDCMLFMNRAMSATEVKAVSDLFASDDLLPYL